MSISSRGPETGEGTGKESRERYCRALQMREVAVFLFLIAPSLALSFFVSAGAGAGFVSLAFMVILRDLSLLSLVLYFLWRNRERFASIGWRARNPVREAVLGVWLYLPLAAAIGLLERALQAAGLSGPSGQSVLSAPKSTAAYVLASLLVLVVAVSEETIFRGYLLLRFRNLSTSTTAAVIGSSVIFSIGHGYEGSSGVVVTCMIGFVFAVVAVWRRSLVAPIVMHFLQDFLGIVLLPLLGP